MLISCIPMTISSTDKKPISRQLALGLILFVVLFSGFTQAADHEAAHGVVVVHVENQADLDRIQIRKIFLGNQKTFNNGLNAKPIQLDDNEEVSRHFNLNIIHKNNRQLKAYWAKKIFTGKGMPPKSASVEQLMQKLIEEPGTIGYLGTDVQLNDSLRIVEYF